MARARAIPESSLLSRAESIGKQYGERVRIAANHCVLFEWNAALHRDGLYGPHVPTELVNGSAIVVTRD